MAKSPTLTYLVSTNLLPTLRDPNVVWYGPYPCPYCTKTIIQTGNGAPKLALDASDHNHHYPNHTWREHVCSIVMPTERKALGGSKHKIPKLAKKKSARRSNPK